MTTCCDLGTVRCWNKLKVGDCLHSHHVYPVYSRLHNCRKVCKEKRCRDSPRVTWTSHICEENQKLAESVLFNKKSGPWSPASPTFLIVDTLHLFITLSYCRLCIKYILRVSNRVHVGVPGLDLAQNRDKALPEDKGLKILAKTIVLFNSIRWLQKQH